MGGVVIVPGSGRGAVPDAGVWSATVVEHLDVLGDGEPCPSAGGEHLLVVHLVFQSGEERLRGGVVPALSG